MNYSISGSKLLDITMNMFQLIIGREKHSYLQRLTQLPILLSVLLVVIKSGTGTQGEVSWL